MKKLITIILFFAFFLFNGPGFAMEPAPRISDREIIESLAEIKTEIKAIKQEVAIQFEQVDKRIDDLRADMNTRFEDTDAINKMFFGFRDLEITN